MKTISEISLATFILFLFSSVMIAQDIPDSNQVKTIQHGNGFVDADGDGYNDNAPDHDGDGIPNGLDPDYKAGMQRKGFVDLDGDGINDNAGKGKRNKRKSKFKNSTEFGNNGTGAQQGNVTGLGNKYKNGSGSTNGNGNNSKGNKGNGNRKSGS